MLHGTLVYGQARGPAPEGEEMELCLMGDGRRVRLGRNARLVLTAVGFDNQGQAPAVFSLTDDRLEPILTARVAPGESPWWTYHIKPVPLPPGCRPRLVTPGRGGVLVQGLVQLGEDLDRGGLADAA
jgi:hypothetical protein